VLLRFVPLLLAVLAPLGALQAQSNYATPYVFTTIAGAASMGSTDGTDSSARFNGPWDVKVDDSGNFYVADTTNNTIRKITPAGVVTTFAGSAGNEGSADGAGSTARFNQPGGIATDSAGNVYVADTDNNTIRRITPAGVVSTLAGSAGNEGSSDGTGTAALFNGPAGLVVDSAGNVFVADTYNDTIRKITPTAMGGATNWVVTTLAGVARAWGSSDGSGSGALFADPMGIVLDGANDLYVTDAANDTIRRITPDGSVTTIAGSAGKQDSTDGSGSAARFYYPMGIVEDSTGDFYVADSGNGTIRKITPIVTGGVANWVVTTVAGSARYYGAADGTGSAAQFSYPRGETIDSAGNLFVTDVTMNTIRKVTPAGVVTTFAGSARSQGTTDGTGSAALFNDPWGGAVDGAGNVYVADTDNNTIRRITPTVVNGVTNWVVTTIAGSAGNSGSADGSGSDARCYGPNNLTVDSSGNVFVADCVNHTIREITPTVVGGVTNWVVTTIAGSAASSGSADGTGTAARFYYPSAVAVDGSDNLYVADSDNHTIRKITPTVVGGATNWVVTTIAGTAGTYGSTDGTGTAAQFFNPGGLAMDRAGNLYVADTSNMLLRKITPTSGGGGTNWVVTTIAGSGSWGYADGTGTAASFSEFSSVAVDGSGNLYVADYGNDLIRKVTPTVGGGGTNWVVTTLAGSFNHASSADGTGSAALFRWPAAIAVDSAGNLYVVDAGDNTIRAGSSAAIVPAITAQPVSRVVDAGGSVSFSVAASGPPATLTYQWQRLPSGSSTWTDLTEGGPYGGTATTTLTVSNTTAAMNGDQFRCLVSNGGNQEVSSLAATLTVFSLSDPAFLQQLYLDVLGRPIDSGGAAFFGAALAAGESRAHVLGDLLGSTEYNLRQIDSVIRLYFGAFARCPDAGGLQAWSNALHAGVITLASAGDLFAGSAEFSQEYGSLNNTQFVQQIYVNTLGRQPDSAGLTNCVTYLNAGGSRGAVLVGLSESPEGRANLADPVEIVRLYYLLLQRTPTPAEFQSWLGFLQGSDQTDALFALGYPADLASSDYVQLVFHGFLRRAADPGGLSTFGSALTAGTVSHSSMVTTLLTSAEFNAYVAPVSRLYLGALLRVPDSGGLDNWVAYLRAGNSRQSAGDAFAASSEFANLYGALSNSDYVSALYVNVLGRKVDSTGLTNWVALLNGGASRGQVLIGLSESPEAVARFAPTIRTFLSYFTFLNATPTQADLNYWNSYLATLDNQFRDDLLASSGF
jgi:hypothetical protein